MRATFTLAMTLSMVLLHAGCGNDVENHGSDLGGPDLSAPAGEGATCVSDGDCGSPQLLCAYKIADGCAAKGHCAPVATPTCASVIELCGCNGKTVISGPCFYQPGFAAGPTTGAPASTCNGDGGT